ncbi:hypothetical protein DMC30DRAFT_178148 [Rhodotorula diobovata]|uniref:Uncharacterized protein n=1 Tax=Rhodotorula diobovata TaxID=5288 RepID=A0A5C5FYI2_9BASI|nr:hypothetical protein DMC30DRAFT_178148 [Rhodotorula diobovata]
MCPPAAPALVAPRTLEGKTRSDAVRRTTPVIGEQARTGAETGVVRCPCEPRRQWPPGSPRYMLLLPLLSAHSVARRSRVEAPGAVDVRRAALEPPGLACVNTEPLPAPCFQVALWPSDGAIRRAALPRVRHTDRPRTAARGVSRPASTRISARRSIMASCAAVPSPLHGCDTTPLPWLTRVPAVGRCTNCAAVLAGRTCSYSRLCRTTRSLTCQHKCRYSHSIGRRRRSLLT